MFLALHDQLTGLVNRKFFEERLNLEISRGKRYGNKFALFYLDLDNLKKVNDSLGHTAGDAMLKEAAERFRKLFRETES